MPSVAVYLALLFASVLPRVADPWPDEIGADLPFTLAAAGTILGGVISLLAGWEQERAIKVGGFAGFCIGSAFYCVALLVQVASQL